MAASGAKSEAVRDFLAALVTDGSQICLRPSYVPKLEPELWTWHTLWQRGADSSRPSSQITAALPSDTIGRVALDFSMEPPARRGVRKSVA